MVALAFSSKIKFSRTRSLMEGDEECDSGWGWEEWGFQSGRDFLYHNLIGPDF